MANKTIHDLPELAEKPAYNDLIEFVDISDTTDSAAGSSRKTEFQDFFPRENPPGTAFSDWGIPGRVPIAGATTLVYTPGNTIILATPMRIIRPIIVTSLIVEVETAGSAGALWRLGIYKSGGFGWTRTNTLVLDAGTISAETTGYKEISGLSTQLNYGWYFVGLASSGTGTPRSQRPALLEKPLRASPPTSTSSEPIRYTAPYTNGYLGLPATANFGPGSISSTNAPYAPVLLKWNEV